MNELEEPGKKLLDESPNALFSKGGGIRMVGRATSPSFIIQCLPSVDAGIYNTLEEAAVRWLQLKIEEKI